MPHRRRTPRFLQRCPNDVLFTILGHLLDPVSPRDTALFASTCKYARAFARSALTELKGDAEAVRSLCRAYKLTNLSELSSITRFDVDIMRKKNHIVQQGLWIACVRALPKLQTLIINRNRIGDPGISALANAMGALPALINLNLGANQIGDEGMIKLSDACAMGAMEQLEWLVLDVNKIGDPGVGALADACAKGGLPNLQELRLFRNEIGDAGVSALADACARGSMAKLWYMTIGQNMFSDSAKEQLKVVCKARNIHAMKNLIEYL